MDLVRSCDLIFTGRHCEFGVARGCARTDSTNLLLISFFPKRNSCQEARYCMKLHGVDTMSVDKMS